MEASPVSLPRLASTSSDLVRRLLTIGANRIELLTVELQEERERLLQVGLLALMLVTFGLLGGITLSAAIVLWLWAWSPLGVLFILTGVYAALGGCAYWRMSHLLRDWQTLGASMEELRKDRESLEKIFS